VYENKEKGENKVNVEAILPIVHSIIRRYKNTNLAYEDLKAECYLSAVIGAKKWEESDKKASLFSWVWISVSGRIRDLNKKESISTVAFDDAFLPLEAFSMDKHLDTSKKESRQRLNKISKTITYQQLRQSMFPVQTLTLKKVISRQRVHQIQNKAQEILASLGK